MGPTGLSPAVRIIMIDSESRVIIITGINPSHCHGESSVMSSVSGPPEARARRKLGNLNRSTSSPECPVIRTIRLLPAAAFDSVAFMAVVPQWSRCRAAAPQPPAAGASAKTVRDVKSVKMQIRAIFFVFYLYTPSPCLSISTSSSYFTSLKNSAVSSPNILLVCVR